VFHNNHLSIFLLFMMCNASDSVNDVWEAIWVRVVNIGLILDFFQVTLCFVSYSE